VHVALAGGIGLGVRDFALPTEVGIVRLTTDPFPAATISLGIDVEPSARGRVSVGGGLRYATSVGLRADDTRTDGSTRNTASRSQRLDLEAGATLRLADGEGAVALSALVGWGVRIFSSEAPVTLPDYAIGGPSLRALLVVPVSTRFTVTAGPDVQWVVHVGDALRDAGVSTGGAALGAELAVRFGLTDTLSLEAWYRESHALLSSTRGDATDVERWTALRAVYRP
jgi:hypothetical protein